MVTTSNITGDIVIPSGAAFTDAVVTFKLSATDTEGAQVLPGGGVVQYALVGAAMPAVAPLWRNTEGLAGTHYTVTLTANVVTDLGGGQSRTVSKTFPLRDVQVGDAATYDIGELMNNPVGDAAEWARQVRFHATRGNFVDEASYTTYPVGTVVDCEGLSYRYTGAGTAIGDLPGWVPNNDIFARHFASAENFDQATQTGTDDHAAITAAMAYAASERKPGVAGGDVWITWRSLVSAPVVIPLGVRLRAVTRRASIGQGQTADSAFPIVFNEGSGFVGSHLVGPVILCMSNESTPEDLTIGSTAARRAAPISTGALNRNCGVLVTTADSPSANIQRMTLTRLLIRDQPAEGYVVCGDIAEFLDSECHAHNCGSHGFVLDDGSLVGRVNKARPGLAIVNQWRGNNFGGHLWAIGHPSSGSACPYRVILNNCEGFRSGNVPALRYEDAGTYVYGEQVTFNNCAPSGTTGYSGSTIGATYAAFTAGRGIHYNLCRFINAEKAMLVGSETGLGTTDVKINGGHFSTTATSPDYAIDVTAVVRGLFVMGMTGDYNIAPLDAAAMAAFNSDGYGSQVYTDPTDLDGRSVSWNLPLDEPTEHEWQIGGVEEMNLNGSRLYLAQSLRFGVDATMPSGMGTNVVGVQGVDAPTTLVGMLRESADSGGPRIRMGKQRAGFADLTTGDILGQLVGAAPDGTSAMVDAASIQLQADSSTEPYGRVVISTRGATGAEVEAVRVTREQQVGIGTAGTIDNAALLQLTSTTRGFLLPRMTTGERDAIASPPNGLQIYNATTGKFQGRAAGAWVDLH